MFIINNKKIFLSISGALVVLAIISIFTFGLNFGIDFKGGSILEIEYINERPTLDTLREQDKALRLTEVLIQPTGELGYIIRTENLEENEHALLLKALSVDGLYSLEEKRFNSIGPSIGAELRSKAWIAIVVVVLAIIFFIAYVFRKVTEEGTNQGGKVSSWKYGFVAVIALAHDIIIPAGIFAAVGFEIDSLFVIAALAILGLSINDTIVVFDRVRENIRLGVSKNFAETVGMSLKQTYVRSINTSLTTLFVLLTLVFIGPTTTQHFAFALALGIIFGTYSSIFIASPLLVLISQHGENKK
ncbi:MAG TPA: protein translocase subunit SecF [Candidatus Yonathbacteria bacterium]|nr:protein translocase subunit SecF [Candidatus Yonathbacteria bacterium]